MWSNSSMSTTLLVRATPTRSTNARMAAADTPRRRSPARVGMRGSSQPHTCPSSTSWISLRLDMTTWVIASRANSYWRGTGGSKMASTNQSYSSRLFSNSSVQNEWVTPSCASDRPWAKSYIG